MKIYTQAEYNDFPVDKYGVKYCPSGDYTAIKQFGERCSFGEKCSFGEECSFGEWCSFGKGCKQNLHSGLSFMNRHLKLRVKSYLLPQHGTIGLKGSTWM